MDLEEVEKLIELMNSHDLVELEIEKGGERIRLKKENGLAPQVMFSAPPAISVPNPAAPAGADVEPVEGASVTFNSPMVGTFYVSPTPGTDPFVRVGDRVGSSTVLCIVEAMKVMNEITADMEGEILEVLVGNGEAVEYNQPLFTLKPR